MCVELKMCCCCLPLRLGSLLLGYINLINSIIKNYWSLITVITVLSVIGNGDSDQIEQVNIVQTTTAIIVVIILIFETLNFIFAISVLVGLHEKKSGIIKAYIAYGTFYLAMDTIVLIGKGISDRFQTTNKTLIDVINVALSIYFLNVVRSYYMKMNNLNKCHDEENTAKSDFDYALY